MVSPKTFKIAGVGLVVAAVAIGLGVGLSRNSGANKTTSASRARGYDQCRRLIDGRYASPTNDVFEGKTRNLQWGSDGHAAYTGGNAAAGGGSKSGGSSKGGSKGHSARGSSKSGGSKSHSAHGSSKSGGSKSHSKGSYYHHGSKGHQNMKVESKSKGSYAYCSKGSEVPYYDPCAPIQYVPCSCSNPGSKGEIWKSDGYGRDLEWGSDGYSGIFSSGVSKASSGVSKGYSGSHSKSGGGSSSKGGRVVSKSSATGSSSKGWHSSKANASKGSYTGSSKGWHAGASSNKGGSLYANFKGWHSDGYYYGSHSKSSSKGGSSYSGSYKGYNQKATGSKSSYSKGTSPYSGGHAKGYYYFKPAYGVKKGSQSKGSAVQTCFCAVEGSKGWSGNYPSNSGQCTCLAPSRKGSKGSQLAPVPCPCVSPSVPMPSICQPTPHPTPKPVPLIIPPVPSTPAPTPCDAQRFFFVNGVCTNDIFLIGGTAFNSVMECCNVKYGPGSLSNGNCEYVDTCNPEIVTPSPTPCDAQVFFLVNGVCTNEMILLGGTAYISAVECCNVNYGTGSIYNGDCNYVDMCNTYTNSPTSGSTPTVSTEVTGPPTMPDRRGSS